MAMNHRHVLLTCFLVCVLNSAVNCEEDLSRGLGKQYKWHTLSDGLRISQQTDKPLMLIIHKSYCNGCKVFKPKFAESVEAQELSNNFVMVNTMDDEEPQDPRFSPDGRYVPRILFLDSKGNVQLTLYNENGNPKYKYFYFDDQGVVKSMKKALTVLGTKGDL